MKPKRIYFISICLILLFSMVLYRLADIQLFSTEQFGPEDHNLLQESVEQRTQTVLLHNGRGSFLDRSGEALTNPPQQDVVFFPFLKKMDYPLATITEIIQEPGWKVKEWILESYEPFYLSDKLNRSLDSTETEAFQSLNFPGMITVDRSKPGDPSIANHFLGVVRGKGATGLEEAFDEFLASNEEEKLLYHVDAKGDPLFGLNVNYLGQQDAFYPLQLKTTLDTELQEEAERIIDASGMEKGGLVLLDVDTRDVLAMVSRPALEPTDPNKFENQMLTSYAPGSIFKTVIAAAAIENPDVNIRQSYNCDLGLQDGELPERELGMLTFEESFAQSCNYTFATLAKELVKQDADTLEHYATKLGIMDRVGWTGDLFKMDTFSQFLREDPNQIWGDERDKQVPLSVSQTAIGQLNVRVTPLAIANMMATIASDGVKKEVRGVSQLLYRNGTEMTTFPEHSLTESQLSSYSAVKLQELLRQVVESPNGTGRSLQGLNVAGKSGTAEVEDNEGNKISPHHWFAGYFPADQPKYAMVVVTVNGSSSAPTYAAFKDMVSYINGQEQLEIVKKRDPAF